MDASTKLLLQVHEAADALKKAKHFESYMLVLEAIRQMNKERDVAAPRNLTYPAKRAAHE